MRYQNLQLESVVSIRHKGLIERGKIRRIGLATASGKGFRMLTLDVRGETVYMVAHESELFRGVQSEEICA